MSEEEEKPARDENGRLLPGNTANPSGENGLKGLPDHKRTCEYYLNNFTFAELRDLVNDKDRMGRLSVFHAQIVTQLAASIAGGKERGKERERLYDRLYGRAVLETRLTGKDGSPLFANDRDALRRRLLSPVTAAGTGEAAGGDDGRGDDEPTV